MFDFKTAFFFCLFFSTSQPLFAQETADSLALPNIYIDCDFCDRTYLRRELDFVNQMRDQADADVYILVTSRGTASGGRSYRLSFEGRNEYEAIRQTLEHISQQSETDDERRIGLAQVMKMGLMPYLSQTSHARRFDIDYVAGEQRRVGLGQDDPWNSWVFNVRVGGDVDVEESQNDFGFDGRFSVSRVTEAIKLGTDFDVELQEENFKRGEGTIRSTSREIQWDVELVKSIDRHWSYGFDTGFLSTTFRNTKARWDFRPAIEFNVYPWEESDRRSITFAYFAGVQQIAYFDETIYGKTREALLSQAFRIQVDFEQPWGEMSAQVEGSHYLHDFSHNRLEIFSFLDIRITRGLSLFLRGSAELIHDQLSLPAGDASLEEILLRQRQLATDFQLSGSIGLRLTFGSIYNNVVNQRL